jgi:peptidyl-prolyl cis-trans isomerase B (cyclophilin B)
MRRWLLLAMIAAMCTSPSFAATTPAKHPAGGKAAAAKSAKDPVIKQIDLFIAGAKIARGDPSWKTRLPKPPQATFDTSRSYYARMVTNKGTIRIQLLPDVAPMHVTNFIYLTRLGFYDGLSFHRVITGFMAQGGCPLGNGTGNPGYGFGGEFDPVVTHDQPGRLSMANAGPGTDGSQFFLTFAPTPWLDGKHTIFGQIVDGMDVLKSLEAAGSPSGQPLEPLRMESVTIENGQGKVLTPPAAPKSSPRAR